MGTMSKEELLEYAAFAKVHSNHPIVQSIWSAYGKVIKEEAIQGYNKISGHGIQVTVNGKEILVGNAKFMTKEQISFKEPNEIGSIVHVAVDKQYAGYIIV